MRDNLAGALWRLGVFVAVCGVVAVALFAVFAQWRFQPEQTYTADFTNISGLASLISLYDFRDFPDVFPF